jgi:hypothetical protein
MRKTAIITMLLAACACTEAVGAVDIAKDTSAWSHRVTIKPDDAPSAGLVEVELPPDIFDRSRANLADLRLLDAAGNEIPYVIRRTAGASRRESVAARVYNRTYVPGEKSTATVEFRERVPKNHIRIETAGSDFRRRVNIEASHDRENWQMVRQGAFLFKVSGNRRAEPYEKATVTIPESDHRYLRLTVFNAPDDPRQVKIENVKAWRTIRTPPETVEVPLAETGVTQCAHCNRTDVKFDLRYRHLPLHQFEVNFEDANFFRRYSLVGRQSKHRTLSRPTEHGPSHKETVLAPWLPVQRGALYHYSAGSEPDQNLSVPLEGTSYRHLWLRIYNGDNDPLQFSGAAVRRLRCYLAFEPVAEAPVTLYLGSREAGQPDYDLPRYASRLRKEGTTRASLGPVKPNPAAKAEERGNWAERNRWIIWLVLSFLTLTLGALIYRQARAARAT